MPNRMLIEVAGIVLAITSERPLETIYLDPNYRDFLSSGEPVLSLQAHYGDLPEVSLHQADLIFDSQVHWRLYRASGQHIFEIRPPGAGLVPYRIARFDRDFKRGDVYSRLLESPVDGLLPNPLEYPLAELLMISMLGQGRGLMVHACGVEDGGRGYLFAGNSTHGKTTIARLWEHAASILNDDRIILRQREGRFWMYGTPWHGEYTAVSSQGVPLEKIFFLRHAQFNTTIRKRGVAASARLLSRCFPPLWDAACMEYTLGFCAELVDAVPCFELGFVPDDAVLEVIQRAA